ncbi:putative glutamine synthetase [Piptocephalis cylindrospora]|uniref:Putative glutamine synthetase n=1 Tax=Piptocephalis cylindrospora TaxID=1907219 RepID=A0A4P9Y8E3_9FUNG|nr:putative glutamine synthetase [Piptocephalis cylindrospora]|eukprot:RKP14601.1 putative glutamine synthetase [Piptocephalis cylindrospora]
MTAKDQKRLRVALLIADTPPDPVKESYGDYPKMFTSLLDAALHVLSPNTHQLETVAFDVRHAQDYPENLDEFDGALITGSAADSHSDEPWILRLVQWCADLPLTFRVIGICFGHQVIARALGATVVRNPKGWEVGWTEINLSADGKRLLGRDTLRLHQMHRDHLLDMPKREDGTIQCLGSTPISPIHGLFLPGRLLTVQGHPEFHTGIIEKLVEIRTAKGIFSPEFAKDILNRNEQEDDRLLFAEVMVRFLTQE